MRAIPARGITLGLFLALALSTAQAQGPPGGMPFPMMGGPGGPGGGPDGSTLLMSPAIQEDLALTDKQKTQLKGLQSSFMQKFREEMAQAREEGMEPQAMMEGMMALRREQEGKVSKVLTKDQKSRLAQIDLQREGLLNTAKSDVATKLKLNATQSRKIKAVVDETRQAQFKAMFPPPGSGGFPGVPGGFAGGPPGGDGQGQPGVDNGQGGAGGPGGPPAGGFPGGPGGFPGGPGGFPGGPGGMPNFNSPEFRAQIAKMMESQKKLSDAATAKITEVLTPEQNAAFEKMLGKPFDYSKLMPGPPPGGATPKADEATPKADEAAPKADPGTMKKDAPTRPRGKSRKSQTP